MIDIQEITVFYKVTYERVTQIPEDSVRMTTFKLI